MSMSLLKKLYEGLMPPLVERKLLAGRARAREAERFAAFYGGFVGAGHLVFDVGANLGNRVRAFRRLGCKVVAIEPQRACVAALRREFGGDAEVVIVAAAAGAAAGSAMLRTSPDHVLSSMSDEFIRRTKASGRFAASEWTGEEEVEVVTLDALVEAHGVPRFLKMDVEGFEAEVVAGLSRPVPVVSFEWTPELSENAIATVNRLAALGAYRFNLSWGESLRLSKPEWWSRDEVLAVIELMAGESLMFGDIYAKLGMR
jgi:FkbM family methyltransferase